MDHGFQNTSRYLQNPFGRTATGIPPSHLTFLSPDNKETCHQQTKQPNIFRCFMTPQDLLPEVVISHCETAWPALPEAKGQGGGPSSIPHREANWAVS